jgi:ATP-dependent RNA helicase DHX57
VLMSATLDSATFESYFTGMASVGQVEIEGRTHPVTDVYLDEILQAVGFGGMPVEDESQSVVDSVLDNESRKVDSRTITTALRAVGTRINYDLLAQTVQLIDYGLGEEEGGILIFLPGVAEIDQTLRALRDLPGLHVLPLHASMQSVEQRRVFQKPPRGSRKVIAATNVAETSITIDDIVAVIDTLITWSSSPKSGHHAQLASNAEVVLAEYGPELATSYSHAVRRLRWTRGQSLKLGEYRLSNSACP